MGGPDVSEFENTPRPKKNIFHAALWSDEDAVKRFLDEEGVLPNSTNSLLQTAAHIAAAHRSEDILEYLLDKDPSLVFATDKWGQTPLHVAIQKGFSDIVEYLVEKRNADMYQPIQGRFNNTAIHLAAEECRMEIMIYFVEQRIADINVRNGLGEPPIFSAASNAHLDMVQYLMSKGANATMVDKNDDNILFVSAKRGDLAVPKYLLDVKKIHFKIDWRNNFGETVLHRAVKYKQLDFMKYFVETKHIDIDIFDNLDRTAVYIAVEMGDLELVKYLVEHEANYKLNDLAGYLPVEIATDPQVKEYLLSLEKQRRRRNVVAPYVIERARLSNFEGSTKLLSGHQLDFRRPADHQHFQIGDVLALMDVCFRYLTYSKDKGKKHESFASPAEILRDRVDKIAMLAIDAENVFDR